jgi:hypothetical protein
MITFDPANKIIQLDTFSASEKTIWSAMVDWSVLSDNLKYAVGMTQLGGVVPVALYIFLERGWQVRPVESNGTTTITGNLLVQGGGSPIAATTGTYQTLVNMETPVLAVAIETSAPVDLANVIENQVAMNTGIQSASDVIPYSDALPNT